MLSAILFTFQKAWRSPLPNSILNCGAFVSSHHNHKPFIYFKETVVISLLAGVQLLCLFLKERAWRSRDL